jgi:hypothetical protein
MSSPRSLAVTSQLRVNPGSVGTAVNEPPCHNKAPEGEMI